MIPASAKSQGPMSVDVKSPSSIVAGTRSADGRGGASCSRHSPGATGKRGVFLFLIVTGLLALTIDVPLSRAMVEDHALKSLHRFLEMMEPFGQPPAVIVVSLAVLLCGGARRGASLRIAAGGLASGLAVDMLKLCVARIRPRHFNFPGSVVETFLGLLPGAGGGSHLQSWPSGHTATAVGFCLALSAVFPGGRWLFRVLALLVALQRIESGAHYLSDTLFAASVAYVVHLAVFGSGPVGRWFDRIEARRMGSQARA
jgi:membrane-associated phospholipid phosphatase